MNATVRACLLTLLALVFVGAGCGEFVPDPEGRVVIHLAPTPGESAEAFQVRVRQAFNLVQPGTILEFGAGTFSFTSGLSVSASHVIVRGQGMDETQLDFSGSNDPEGILATGDHFAIHDLAILEAPGDGVKSVGIEGFTARRVRVEWASFEDPNNGPYGIYPVLTKDILIEYCVVRGAEDAAIYVGQSENALVRWTWVENSVAGIEIENTIGGEVKWNVATSNTAGVLVFDLPGLSQSGRSTSVHHNWIYDNNGTNFGSGIVGEVPSGTGVLVVSTDDVEIYENEIHDHATLGIGVLSYEVVGLVAGGSPAGFDAWPETVHIHDNVLSNNAYAPSSTDPIVAVIAFQFAPNPMPQMIWDGVRNDDLLDTSVDPEGRLPDPLRFCVQNNGGASFGRMSQAPSSIDRFSTAGYQCSHPAVAGIVIPEPPPVPTLAEELSPEETAALCGATPAGVNWPALEANCPFLADYNLFQGNDPRGPVTEAGLEYDLTTPLFSDYANKYRFVFVPPGEAASYDATGIFDMPVGTIISKTFAFDLPGGGERVVETRLLVRRASRWKSLVYLWDETLTTATFAPEGAIVEVTFQHPADAPGVGRTIQYGVPDVNQCAGCHSGISDGMDLIGPKARLLNRPVPGDPLGPNQLVQWEAAGILTGLPSDLASVDRLPVWDDPADGTLGERARAYLESNCAHCHRPGGRAGFTSLWLNIETAEGFNLGFCKSPIAAGAGSGGLSFDVVPGNAAESILVFRMDSAEPAVEMPELAKAIVHDAGVDLVSSWVDSLPPDDCMVE